MKMALSPGLRMFDAPPAVRVGVAGGGVVQGGWSAAAAPMAGSATGPSVVGSVIGEVADGSGEVDPGVVGRVKRSRTAAVPVQTVEYTNDFDVGLLSPGVTDPGFGEAIPGLASGLLWQPMLTNPGNWATSETPTGVEPLDGFSFGQELGTEGFAYGTFGAGNTMDGNGNLMAGSNGYPRYQPAPGIEPGAADGQVNYMAALQDDGGQRRKRNWEGSLGAW
jgi:hypothetical protein